MKRIFILEDQPVCFNFLTKIVASVFNEASITHREKLKDIQTVDAMNHDIAFIDLSLPDGFSFDIIKNFSENNPELLIIITTLYADDDKVFQALQAGAQGYLLKCDGEKQITKSLLRMLDGEPAISPQIARKLITFFNASTAVISRTKEKTHELIELNQREKKILNMISDGYTTKAISSELNRSHYTISDNIKVIYRKLKVTSRSQAITTAIKYGLI